MPPPAHIAFIHSTSRYNGNTFREQPLGGAESATIQLAEALAARGHRVTGLTGIDAPAEVNGVSWLPVAGPGQVTADLAVANSVATDLHYVRAQRRVVWIHNTRTFDRFLRKGGALATFRYLPEAVVLGKYHARSVSPFIPYRRRVTIPLAVGEPFLSAPVAEQAPPPRAIHFSQPHRDAANLVRIWVEHVHPRVPEAEFHVFCGDWWPDGISAEALSDAGVILRERLPREKLVKEMAKARAMLYRGFKDETFCLAAAESIAMGLPVVTAGIGSLAERVTHGETGLIAETDEAFAEAAIGVLTDDALWETLHKGGLATRNRNGWEQVAARWEAAFLSG